MSARVEAVPRVAWEQVRDYFATQHQLGEHVAIEGPTGSGKSVLALSLLEARGRRTTTNKRPVSIAILAVKPRDRTLAAMVTAGKKSGQWKRLTKAEEWPPPFGSEHVIVWPGYGNPSSATGRQRAVFQPVLQEIMASGNQIVYIDETAYFEEPYPNGLGLAPLLNQFWYLSRSNGVSLVAATQRPRRVSRSMWSEPFWLFLFRPEDEEDLKRVAQLSGRKQLVMEVLPTLDTHEFLMLRRRPKQLAVVSQVET